MVAAADDRRRSGGEERGEREEWIWERGEGSGVDESRRENRGGEGGVLIPSPSAPARRSGATRPCSDRAWGTGGVGDRWGLGGPVGQGGPRPRGRGGAGLVSPVEGALHFKIYLLIYIYIYISVLFRLGH